MRRALLSLGLASAMLGVALAAAGAGPLCVEPPGGGGSLCVSMPASCAAVAFGRAVTVCAASGATICSQRQLALLPAFSILSKALPCYLGTLTQPTYVWTSDSCSNGHYAARIDGQVPRCYRAGAQSLFACCAQASAATPAPSMPPPTHSPALLPKIKFNLVLLVVDDARPDISSVYEAKGAITPNLDKLARRRGTVAFSRAFSSFPECAPSRTSVWFGRPPQQTGILNNVGNARAMPGSSTWQTLFQVFRNNGYLAFSGGKVFHPFVEDPASFTSIFAPNIVEGTGGGGSVGPDSLDSCYLDRLAVPLNPNLPLSLACVTPSLSHIPDYVTASQAVANLKALDAQANRTPFVLAAGFAKPHTPFHIYEPFSQKFHKGAYPYGQVDLISPLLQPQSTYKNIPYFDPWNSICFTDQYCTPSLKATSAVQRISIHAAYAMAMSQTDAWIGMILDTISNSTHLAGNTVIVVLADHGYFLGEHAIFAKNSLFDISTRVPVMFSLPSLLLPASKANGPIVIDQVVELLDMYRTIAGLLGLSRSVDAAIAGHDFSANMVTALSSGSTKSLTWPSTSGMAFAQVLRCAPSNQNCVTSTNLSTDVIAQGFTVRTSSWRYTLWLNSAGLEADWSSPLGEELYDHSFDHGVFLQDEGYNLVLNRSSALLGNLRQLVASRFG